MALLVDTIDLPAIAGGQMAGFLLVVARVGGLFLLAPGFSSRMIPVRVKLMMAFALSMALLPMATHGRPVGADPGDLALLVLKELAVGVAFALPLALLAAAVQAGATLLDTVIGFSFASQLDPITNVQNAVLSQLYGLVAVMIFMLSGGDQVMIEGVAASYRVVPIDVVPDLAGMAPHLLPLGLDVFVIGLEIAAPVLIALVITDAAFGLVARAVPQMNVFFIGLPAKILVGFMVIGASLPFVAGRLTGQLEQSVFTALKVLHAA
jgi:flagellar biosynthetic protein FliR